MKIRYSSQVLIRGFDSQLIFDRMLQLPDTSLIPNESTMVEESDTVDVCIDGTTQTNLFTGGQDVDSTVTCFEGDVYNIDLCSLDIGVTCEDGNGTECMQLTSRDTDCMVKLTFTSTFTASNDLEVINYEQVVIFDTPTEVPAITTTDLLPLISPVLVGGEQRVVPRTIEFNLCQSFTLVYSIIGAATRDKMRFCDGAEIYVMSIP